jgi:hypothetical protein
MTDSRRELLSVLTTIALVAVAILIAWATYGRPADVLVFSYAVGALGGLVHEIAQSGGKIMFFERKLDGMYLGTLSGMILGGVSGLVIARGIRPDDAQTLFYEALLAGMAMKGLVEATTGEPLPPGQQHVTAPQAAEAEALIAGASTVVSLRGRADTL